MLRETITTRGVTYVGMKCNVKCCFCYYGPVPKGHRDWAPLERFETEFRMMKEIGMTDVDITGGEPSIHPQIERVINLAAVNGLRPRMITNGLESDVGAWKDAGLDSLLISCQSGDKDVHNSMVAGGDWDLTVDTMEECVNHGIPFSVNSTITKMNHKCQPRLSEFVAGIGATAHNMIMMNPFCWPKLYAKKNTLYVREWEAAPYLKEALSLGGSCHRMVRYIAFCRMKGHEHQVMNWYQLPYDDNEWNYMAWHADYYGMLFTPGDYRAISYHEVSTHYKKGEECFTCAARDICGGFKERVYGFDHTFSPRPVPYTGELIEDPLHFWREHNEIHRTEGTK